MEWDFGAGVVAVLLGALAVLFILLGDRFFSRARSHAGRAVAVAARLFGLTREEALRMNQICNNPFLGKPHAIN